MENEKTKKKGLEERVKELEEWAALMVEWGKTVGGIQTESETPPGNPPPFPPR
jgi:hypothetical protein